MATSNVAERIKERLDIAEIVSRYVQLKKSGKNQFGLCPFHHEKTPSFSVNSDLGMYKCFGCGESGDVISFIEKLEGMDFREALEFLGKEAGVKVDFSKYSTAEDKKRDKLFSLNKLARKFYQYILVKHKYGEEARSYVKKRGFEDQSIEDFGVGYAPAQPQQNKKDIFIKFARSKGWSQKALIEGGLAVQKNGQVVDKFRERLMFTIYDLKGRPVAFSGRIIKPSDYAPKYLNSPETLVFHKGSLPYGLYQSKSEIRQKDSAILVEGQTDVISSHQAGVKNIIAPLGTSLSEGHLKSVKRYSKNLAICFDQDLAGETAVKRTVQLAQGLDFDVQAIPLKNVKDVDELIQKSASEWQKISQKPIPIVDYLLERLMKRINIRSIDGKVELISEIAPFVIAIPSRLKKDHYTTEISRQLDVEKDLVIENINKAGREASSYSQDFKQEIKAKMSSRSTKNRELYIVGRIIQYPQVAFKLRRRFKQKIFRDDELKGFIKEFMGCEDLEEFEKVLTKLDAEFLEKIADYALSNIGTDENLTDVRDDFVEGLSLLEEQYLKEEIRKMNQEMKKAIGPSKQEILQNIKDLSKKLGKIQKDRDK